jgi:hypothetical protein
MYWQQPAKNVSLLYAELNATLSETSAEVKFIA